MYVPIHTKMYITASKQGTQGPRAPDFRKHSHTRTKCVYMYKEMCIAASGKGMHGRSPDFLIYLHMHTHAHTQQVEKARKADDELTCSYIYTYAHM
jgi:hypothetical protein